MPNNIPERQNEPAFVQRVAASSGAYNRARTFGKWQVWLSGAAAVLGPGARAFFPAASGAVGIFAFGVVVADLLYLERRHRHYRNLGAKIQEVFDTKLLELPWNRHRCHAEPDAEDINRLAATYLSKHSTEGLQDWYPRAVASLPLECARFVCQRANMRWDMELRKKFATGFYFVAAAMALLVALAAIWLDLSANQLVVSLILPMTPATIKLVREGRKHFESAQTSQKAKELLEDAWQGALHEQTSNAELLEESRRLQDELFDRRRGSPIIPQRLYDYLRKEFEEDMDCAAAKMVNEYHQAVGATNA